eukprot:5687396-Alexandrium_andersonii.AAC.1
MLCAWGAEKLWGMPGTSRSCFGFSTMSTPQDWANERAIRAICDGLRVGLGPAQLESCKAAADPVLLEVTGSVENVAQITHNDIEVVGLSFGPIVFLALSGGPHRSPASLSDSEPALVNRICRMSEQHCCGVPASGALQMHHPPC